jgi:hypothetical protein
MMLREGTESFDIDAIAKRHLGSHLGCLKHLLRQLSEAWRCWSSRILEMPHRMYLGLFSEVRPIEHVF